MKYISIVVLCIYTVMHFSGCKGEDLHQHLTASEHIETIKVAEKRGPHGGKLFEKGEFAIEFTIYEPEIPPQSHVYAYKNGKLIDPALVTLVTELHRIDRIDVLHYTKQDDFLNGDKVVEEPHSFDVILKARYNGDDYDWSYSSYEGRTTLSDQAIASTGITIEKVGGATIAKSLSLNGQVVPDRLSVSKLAARFPGVVKEVKKFVGSKVEKGEVIATIEASESLKTYDLVSPRSGELLAVNSAVGEVVSESEALAIVGDLSTVWIELSVPKSSFSALKIGQKVIVNSGENSEAVYEKREGTLTFISPLADGDSQTLIARAEISNLDRELIPALFVEAQIVIEERQVPVAIKAEALQKFRDWDVVFKRVGQVFEIAILELGEVHFGSR